METVKSLNDDFFIEVKITQFPSRDYDRKPQLTSPIVNFTYQPNQDIDLSFSIFFILAGNLLFVTHYFIKARTQFEFASGDII